MSFKETGGSLHFHPHGRGRGDGGERAVPLGPVPVASQRPQASKSQRAGRGSSASPASEYLNARHAKCGAAHLTYGQEGFFQNEAAKRTVSAAPGKAGQRSSYAFKMQNTFANSVTGVLSPFKG